MDEDRNMKEKQVYVEEEFSHGELQRRFYEVLELQKDNRVSEHFRCRIYVPRTKLLRETTMILDKRKKNPLREATEIEAQEYEEAKLLNMLRTKL